MFKFSDKSKAKLSTAHPKLQQLFYEVIKYVDCTVLEGHRDQATQDEYFRTGKSRVKFPHGKHNSLPSNAVDVVPYPIDWNDISRFYHFAGFVRGVAASLGINIRCGADWDGDFSFADQDFHDLPHFELED